MPEQDVTFVSHGFKLAGTLALPEGNGPFPAAVFIAGSGQVDRNENHVKMSLNTFNALAARLAENGIASLRFDKRGAGGSEGDFHTTGFHDNAADVRAAFQWLQQREEADASRVVLIGHSEGAMLATRLAGAGLPAAGIILLAGTVRPGEEVILWQAAQIVPLMKGLQGWLVRTLHIDALKAQRKTIDKIKKSTSDSFRMQLIARVNAKWMREFLAYDPSGDLAAIRCPVLAVTGSNDIQVNPADVELMAKLVKTDFEGHVIPGISHILRAGEKGLDDYHRQVREPMDERVIKLVLDWLERKLVSHRAG